VRTPTTFGKGTSPSLVFFSLKLGPCCIQNLLFCHFVVAFGVDLQPVYEREESNAEEENTCPKEGFNGFVRPRLGQQPTPTYERQSAYKVTVFVGFFFVIDGIGDFSHGVVQLDPVCGGLHATGKPENKRNKEATETKLECSIVATTTSTAESIEHSRDADRQTHSSDDQSKKDVGCPNTLLFFEGLMVLEGMSDSLDGGSVHPAVRGLGFGFR